MDDAAEKVARAMWEAGWQSPWDKVDLHTRHLTYNQAAAAIATYDTHLAERGFVTAPREPTEKMATIGGCAIGDEVPKTWVESRKRGAEIYRAMIEAYEGDKS